MPSQPETGLPAARPLPFAVGAVLILLAVALIGSHLLPRAFFCCDDYRYLSLLRDVDAGRPGAVGSALVIENRWDGNWWIEDGSCVRFFRPLLIASIAADRALWGEQPLGFVLSNLLLHAAASLLAFAVLRRVAGAGWTSVLGGVVFAVMTCRREQLYFVAGRNDTLAGLLFFLGLALYLARRDRLGAGSHVAIALAYAGALLSKEYCAVLPLGFLLLDRFVPEPGRAVGEPWTALVRRRLRLYVVLAGVLAAFLVARAAVLGEAGSGSRPFPYFFMPGREGFAGRTLAVWLYYASSLCCGTTVRPFLSGFAQLHEFVAWPWLAIGGLGVPALLLWGARTPAGRFCALLFLLMLLPVLPVYSSGRYLYIPTLGWCGLLALAATALAQRRRALGLLFGALVIAPQAAGLWLDIESIPEDSPTHNAAFTMRDTVQRGDLDLASDRPIYLLDFPRRWVEMQFLQSVLDVTLPDAPRVTILCRSPWTVEQGLVRASRVDDHTIEIERPNERLYIPEEGFDFDQRRVRPGDVIREDGYSVEVLATRERQASRVRVHFDKPLDEMQVGLCAPAGNVWQVRRMP